MSSYWARWNVIDMGSVDMNRSCYHLNYIGGRRLAVVGMDMHVDCAEMGVACAGAHGPARSKGPCKKNPMNYEEVADGVGEEKSSTSALRKKLIVKVNGTMSRLAVGLAGVGIRTGDYSHETHVLGR